jgi:hypothetical protein
MTLYSPEHLEAIRTREDWTAELRRQFGKHADDAQHTMEALGTANSKLRELYIVHMIAQEDWYASMGFGSDD